MFLFKEEQQQQQQQHERQFDIVRSKSKQHADSTVNCKRGDSCVTKAAVAFVARLPVLGSERARLVDEFIFDDAKLNVADSNVERGAAPSVDTKGSF